MNLVYNPSRITKTKLFLSLSSENEINFGPLICESEELLAH